MASRTYDETLNDAIEQMRTGCEDMERQLASYFAERASKETATEQAASLKGPQSVVKGAATSAKDLQARLLKAEPAPRVMQELADLIRRLEAMQREIDRRLASR